MTFEPRRRLLPILAALVALGVTGCSGFAPVSSEGPARSTLVLASFNMEHLAERDGTGCRPRTASDYAALRAYVEALQADVVAVQEVESEAAAHRVFDPRVWTVVLEDREGSARSAECRGLAGRFLTAQKTGFAIRRDLAFERLVDFDDLQLGDPDLRSGVDVVVRPLAGTPVRLLSVHLKSGCSAGDRNAACPVFFGQTPLLEAWIDARAEEDLPFVVLGDFNRRLALPMDRVWADWDDGEPANSDLTLAAGDRKPACDPRYSEFIDHIVLDRRAAGRAKGFDETVFQGERLSDHCAISVRLRVN